jgi:hypothetical protein
MATMPKPAVLFDNLETIIGQVEEAKGADRETVTYSNQTRAISNKLISDEGYKMLEEKGFSRELVSQVSNQLAEFSKALNPQAAIVWDKEAVNAQVDILNGLASMGYLDDDENAKLSAIRDALKGARIGSGAGQRSERKPQDRIADRAPWVTITDPNGAQISKQVGNVQSSSSNLKQRAVKFLTDSGVTLDDAGVKGIQEAAKAVTEGNEPTSTFGGLVFTQVNE